MGFVASGRIILATAILAAAAWGCDGDSGGPDDVVDSAEPDGLSMDGLADAADSSVLDGLYGDDGTDVADAFDPPPEPAHCMPNIQDFPVRPPVEDPATLDALVVDGRNIVDEDGKPVALRGINFGTWLQNEPWISGIGSRDTDVLIGDAQDRARDLGVLDLVEAAWSLDEGDEPPLEIQLLLEMRSLWSCFQELRRITFLLDDGSRKDELDELWAWWDEQPWVYEEQSLWLYLGKRFGHAGSEILREAFAENYITEEDFKRASEMGFTVVRVPFWYQALETDDVTGSRFRPEGWKHLDNAARWARKHRLWIILDMHGVPGGQSVADHQGLRDGNRLWTEEACALKAARLWQAIASYFKGDPHVAIYDLMNEPMGLKHPDLFGQAAEHYRRVHDGIYKAIRIEDDATIVMIEEGYLDRSALVSPREMNWENAMFSIHLYPTEATTAQEFVERIELEITKTESRYEFSKRYDCPIFIGEFNAIVSVKDPQMAPLAMDGVLQMLGRRGLHWAPWTWKYVSEGSTWGVWHPEDDAGVFVDVENSSFDQIRAAFEGMHSQNFKAYDEYRNALVDRANDPFGEQDLSPVK
jgi:hypothetical protein